MCDAALRRDYSNWMMRNKSSSTLLWPEGGESEQRVSVTHVVALSVGVRVQKDSKSDKVVHASKDGTFRETTTSVRLGSLEAEPVSETLKTHQRRLQSVAIEGQKETKKRSE